jgi:hypothetical protein
VRSTGGSSGSLAEVMSAVASQHARGHAADLLRAAGGAAGDADRARAGILLAAEEAALYCEHAAPEAWRRPRAGEEWSAAGIAGHMVELLPYWTATITGAVAHPGGVLGRDINAPERLGAVVNGDSLTPPEAASLIRSAANAACATLQTMPVEGWSQEISTLRFGVIPAGRAIDALVVRHACDHVSQISRALAVDPG